ncbi:hypothetical protein [Streptomyces coffeae]|uniref:Right-handed parallel beta-helix repeat-containing protein n=1 Tax=Streptomyces coffeae TaxID=621382 RepID=A0ABS1NG13_9ACTN|nr:hypothetical protein [Streptomyces coffeae]MBL1099062.1 hypothetical protein [Streptomyces coffeae]
MALRGECSITERHRNRVVLALTAKGTRMPDIRATVTSATGLGLCLTFLPAGQAQAQTTRVPCNDIAALRAAITDANTGGGSIVLAPRCVYTLRQADNAGDGLPEITGNVQITGDNSIIERSSPAGFRIFHVKEGGSLSLKCITVRYGQTIAGDGDGGGVFNERGTLTLTDSTVRNNIAGVGGGIWNRQGTLTLKNTRVTNNRGGFGGGVATNGTMTMEGGTLHDNTGGEWGGGLANAGDTKLNHVLINGNDAGEYGGGIVTLAINLRTGPLRVDNIKIRDGIARTNGGGLFTGANETTTINRSVITRNTSNGGPTTGGGIGNPGTLLRLFIGGTNSSPRKEVKENKGSKGSKGSKKSKGNSTKQTPFRVDLIQSAVFKNDPTNCAPPNSVPGCDTRRK